MMKSHKVVLVKETLSEHTDINIPQNLPNVHIKITGHGLNTDRRGNAQVLLFWRTGGRSVQY